MSKKYDASNIKVLEGLEAVRRRPSMYIGSTGKSGLHHLVYEVVDNAIDEAMAGYCTEVRIAIEKGHVVTVEDNGRGIPIDTHKETGKPAVEVVMTTLHAGGKFGDGAYKVSGGLHGVGVSVVNALSEWLEVEVRRDGKCYQQRYQRGAPKKAKGDVSKEKSNKTGTLVRFLADKEIFGDIAYDDDVLTHRLQELAFLNKGLKIVFVDKRGEGVEEAYQYEGGIAAYVEHMNENKDPLYKPPIYVEGKDGGVEVEVALQHCKDYYDENVLSFANDIRTREGGFHLSGFRSALTRAINNYARKYDLVKGLGADGFSGNDVREGLTGVVSIKIPNPQFEGQTKTKLGNVEVKGIVDSIVDKTLSTFLETHPHAGRQIIEKASTALRVREAARKAQDIERRKSALEGSTLPGKLADCSERDPAKCEIFIVEGDSAGGSAKQGRDRKFQAILPLRGKILNVEKARLDKILSNEQIRTVITAIGPSAITGLETNGRGDGGEGEAKPGEVTSEEVLSKLRYHKVIIMTDADVDGSHIRTLLLTFFYRYARGVIESGGLYIAQPPLYSVRKGKEEEYAYSDEQLQALTKKYGKAGGYHIQRYKGLGEMNPEQLWRTTMNPETRMLLQVALEDAELADEMFTVLMGSQVEPRRKFIEKHATKVRWLDV